MLLDSHLHPVLTTHRLCIITKSQWFLIKVHRLEAVSNIKIRWVSSKICNNKFHKEIICHTNHTINRNNNHNLLININIKLPIPSTLPHRILKALLLPTTITPQLPLIQPISHFQELHHNINLSLITVINSHSLSHIQEITL